MHAKVMEFGADKRVSRLRVCLEGTEPSPGDPVGEAGADSGQIGVCDQTAFAAAWGSDFEAGWARVEPSLWKEHGIVVLDRDSGAIMPYVSSGFGDGEFPVHGLLGPDGLVGVEIEFIAPTTTYPFD